VDSINFKTAKERHAHYIAKAEEAEARAAQCKEDDTLRAWTELAVSWRFMAVQVAKDFKL